MINEDLKHPRISILHTPERKQDAETFRSKYTNLGARVTLLEVDDDHSTRNHLGKLYYFDESPRFKEIANSLAKDLQGIEQVSPHYLQLSEKQQPNYAIWIVKSHRIQTNQIVAVVPKPDEVESLTLEETVTLKTLNYMVQCPKCPSSVRNDRLDKHLINVHSGKPKPAGTTKKKNSSSHRPIYEAIPRDNRFWVSSSDSLPSSLGKYRCRHCGSVAMYNADACYTCNPK